MAKKKKIRDVSQISEITDTELKLDISGKPTKKKSYPCFIILQGADLIGQIYKAKNNSIIGRGANVYITINDSAVSRDHAKISTLGSRRVFVEDLGSKNGTYVNTSKIEKTELFDGDKVRIGNTILKFDILDEVEMSFQDKLFASSIEDDLTRIYNKKFFFESLAKDFSYAKRHKIHLSIITFDIDDFKKVNDNYGHVEGDFILRSLGKLIKPLIRTEDIFARIGGEEFAIILKNVGKDKAFLFAERIRTLIAKHPFKRQKTHKITVSIGCETFHNKNYETHKQLFEKADGFLLKAKKKGKNVTVKG